MMIKKLIFLILIVANSVIAQENHFSLTGQTSEIPDGTFLYFRDLANGGNIDSALVKNNKFRFDTDLPEPILFVMLFTMNRSHFTELWLEDRPMTFDTRGGDFKKPKVTGSKNHILAMEIEDKIYANTEKIPDDVKNQREKDFINKHPDALVSAYILTVANRRWTQDEIADFYSRLSPAIKKSSIGQKVAKFLEKDIAEVGEKYKDLQVLSAGNETVNISDLLGKITLLQFWSSTCSFSREMNEKTLTSIYSKYHPEGFEIITVSDDTNTEEWTKAIQEDNLNWPRSNNLQSWNEEVFKAYGVLSTPSNFLINNEGVIVARNLRSNNLEKEIEEYLSK